MIRKMFHDAFYQNDGTLDLSRVLMATATFAYIGQGCWALAKGQPFDWAGAGVGIGAVVGGSGAGVMFHGRAP